MYTAGVESNTPTKKEQTTTRAVCVEVFTRGEDICTCGLRASSTPLRAICALLCAKRKWSRIEHTNEKKNRQPQGLSVWRYSPEVKIFALVVYERARHLCVQYANSFAQSANGVESSTPTKKRTDNHKGCLFFFGRSVEIRTPGLQYPKLARYQLRYTSKLLFCF